MIAWRFSLLSKRASLRVKGPRALEVLDALTPVNLKRVFDSQKTRAPFGKGLWTAFLSFQGKIDADVFIASLDGSDADFLLDVDALSANRIGQKLAESFSGSQEDFAQTLAFINGFVL